MVSEIKSLSFYAWTKLTANEKLQNNFIQHVFMSEQEEYARERIKVTKTLLAILLVDWWKRSGILFIL